MYDVYLMVHFLGLAIGAGTPFYMAALAIHAEKTGDPAVVKQTMLGPGGAVSMVGAVGLVLLLVSGVLLLSELPSADQLQGTFKLKLTVVAIIVLYVGSMKFLAKKAKREEGMETMTLIGKLGKLGPLLSLAVIALAVLTFH
jgi:uncharacterized membrane protein